MAKLITNPQIKKVVKDFEREECVELILEMAQACPQAREFLTLKFIKNYTDILEDYKKKVRHEFYPAYGGLGNLCLKDAKKAISDFKKICSDKIMVIDIMLYYVENCIEFTNDYGDIDMKFYNSAGSVYNQVVREINAAGFNVYEKFADRLRAAVDNTKHIGWGFPDDLCNSYHELIWVEN